MEKVNAKIVDFEAGDYGYYYPIFQFYYKGQTKYYKREKRMEQNPFNTNKSYTLHINEKTGKIYEKTEKFNSNNFLLILIASIFIFPPILVLLVFLLPVIFMWVAISNIVHKVTLKIRKDVVEQIPATIVWYKEVRKRKDNHTHYYYYPILEYKYKGKTYQHISKSNTSYPENVGQESFVYIDESRSNVYDEFTVKTGFVGEIIMGIMAMLFGVPMYTSLFNLIADFFGFSANNIFEEMFNNIQGAEISIQTISSIFVLFIFSLFVIPWVKMIIQCVKIKILESTQTPITAKLVSEKDFGNKSSFVYEYYHAGQRKTLQKAKSHSNSEIILYIDPKTDKVYDASEFTQSFIGCIVLGIFFAILFTAFLPPFLSLMMLN